jgi:hypothetical protein
VKEMKTTTTNMARKACCHVSKIHITVILD